MTDSAFNFGAPAMTVLPTGESNPNHPAFSQARERRAEETYTDAMVYMDIRRDMERVLAKLKAREPGSEVFTKAYENWLGLAETLYDELEGDIIQTAPQAFKDWCSAQARR